MSRQAARPPTLAPEAAAAYVNVSPNTFDEMVNHCTHGEVGRTIIRPEMLQIGHGFFHTDLTRITLSGVDQCTAADGVEPEATRRPPTLYPT